MGKQWYWIIQVSVVLMIIKVTGFIRDLLVPKLYGIDGFSDGFYVGLSLVLTLYALIGKAITLNLIPRLKRTEEDYSIIKEFIVPATCLAIALTGIYFISPQWLINLLYVGGDTCIKSFLDMAILALPLVPTLYALMAFHQIRERFFHTHINGLIFNVSIILFTMLNTKVLLPWSLLVAMLLQTLWLLWQFDYKCFLNSPYKWHKAGFSLEIVLISLALSFEQLNLFIDRRFISAFDGGYVTIIDLGSKFSFLFLGIVVLAVTTVIYPKLVKIHQLKDKDSVKKMMLKLLLIMFVLSSVSTLSIFIFGEWGLQLLFGKNYEQAEFLLFTLKMYGVLLVPLSLREVLLRYFILEKETFWLAFFSVLCLSFNGILSATTSNPKVILYATVFSVVTNTLITGLYYIYYQKRGVPHETV